jgi:uncharacterized protein
MYNKILIYIFVTFLFTGIIFSQQEKSLTKNPVKLSEYVTDETNTLTPEQLSTLRAKLRKFYDSTSTQIVVYMINTLNDEPIENAAISIFRFNGIGGKEKNNGVLFLISKNDRKSRIEVGYGLEGALPDATSKLILKNEVSPNFKEGNFYKGIENGINGIILAVKGEYTTGKKESSGGFMSVFITVILVIVFTGGIVFLMYFFAKRSVKKLSAGRAYHPGTNNFSSNTSSNDNYSSGSSDSSSSSDSGFSGDGGSSGGGGASDSW